MAISSGNSKLGNIPNISLTPIKACGNCSACSADCYALKAYRMYKGTKASWDAFFTATKNAKVASFLHHLVTDLADKTVSIFIAAIALSSIPKRFILTKKSK